MSRTALKAHLALDPDLRGYSGMSDSAVSSSLNQLRHLGPTEMTAKEFSGAIGQVIADRMFQTMSVAAASSAIVAKWNNMLDNGLSIDLGNPEVQAMVSGFGANGVLPLTAEDATAINGLAENKQSDAQKYGIPSPVKPGHVLSARAG